MPLDVCTCNGYELRNELYAKYKGLPPRELAAQYDIPIPRPRDEDGFALCPFCGKIEHYPSAGLRRGWNVTQLAECDTCEQPFKGYKKYPKINYTCPDCENEL